MGREALALTCDVSDPASVAALFAELETRLGRLDLLFNNAGVLVRQARLEEVSPEQWAAVVDTNLTGAFLCTQEAFRIVKRSHPRREDHQQRLDLGARAASDPARYTQRSTPSQASRNRVTHGPEYDIACGQIDIGNAPPPSPRR